MLGEARVREQLPEHVGPSSKLVQLQVDPLGPRNELGLYLEARPGSTEDVDRECDLLNGEPSKIDDACEWPLAVLLAFQFHHGSAVEAADMENIHDAEEVDLDTCLVKEPWMAGSKHDKRVNAG